MRRIFWKCGMGSAECGILRSSARPSPDTKPAEAGTPNVGRRPPPHFGGYADRGGGRVRGVITGFFLCWVSAVSALAQVTTNQVASKATIPETPPEPAAAKSPVAVFRELLNMEPSERTKALADRPEETRKRILAKIREYQSLKPDERELRLKVTELGYYLRPLMRTPATNRTAQLAIIPAGYRELVQVRLEK